jgi:hypothetical protein
MNSIDNLCHFGISNLPKLLGFEVLMVMSTKMAVFWVVASCSVVEVYHVLEILAAFIIRVMSKQCTWSQFEV